MYLSPKNMKNPPSKLPKTLALIALLIFAPPIFIILLIRWRWDERREKKYWQQVLHDYNGKNILWCSREHGWQNFLVNNFLPLFDANTIVIWSDEEKNFWLNRRLKHFTISTNNLRTKPILIVIRNNEVVKCTSLHTILLPFKEQERKSTQTQQQLREMFANTFPEITLQ